MPTPEEYTKAMRYEVFIRRAHKYNSQNMRNGASISFMSNLIDAEKGNSNVKHLGSFEKQLNKVVEYIGKAIDAFLKPARKLKDEEKQALLLLKNHLNNVYSTSQLLSIIDQGLEITQPYKE